MWFEVPMAVFSGVWRYGLLDSYRHFGEPYIFCKWEYIELQRTVQIWWQQGTKLGLARTDWARRTVQRILALLRATASLLCDSWLPYTCYCFTQNHSFSHSLCPCKMHFNGPTFFRLFPLLLLVHSQPCSWCSPLPCIHVTFFTFNVIFHPKDGGRKFLQNYGNHLPDYIASHYRKQ